MKTPQHIARLIAYRIMQDKSMTEEDNKVLDEWLHTSRDNQVLYKQISEMKLANQILKLENSHYGQRMVQRFIKTCQRKKQARIRKCGFISIITAACTALVLFFTITHKNWDYDKIEQNTIPFHIQPGKTSATLVLANGKQIDVLTSNQDSLRILIDSMTSMSSSQYCQTESDFHELIIPAGGEFQYTLSDGTQIWLNSQTTLRFPQNFNSKERHIYIHGEAFLKVAKNTNCPFIVSTKRGDIRVYGTSFNITDYDDDIFSTVLIDGSIEFHPKEGRPVKIKPSQCVTYDTENGNISISYVDTSTYTAWINHQFVFKGQTLKNIMKTLARWYDFTPEFQTEDLQHIRLSGRLNRHENIQILLNSFEKTAGIKFTIKEKKITITH